MRAIKVCLTQNEGIKTMVGHLEIWLNCKPLRLFQPIPPFDTLCKMQIEKIKQEVTPILQRHHITRAGLFGSVASGTARDDSDVDILVQLGSKMGLLEFVGIKLELEDKLRKKVDLVEYRAIKPRLKDRILAEEVRIYG